MNCRGASLLTTGLLFTPLSYAADSDYEVGSEGTRAKA